MINKCIKELEEIIRDYDEFLDKAVVYGIFSSSDYEKMDTMLNKGLLNLTILKKSINK